MRPHKTTFLYGALAVLLLLAMHQAEPDSAKNLMNGDLEFDRREEFEKFDNERKDDIRLQQSIAKTAVIGPDRSSGGQDQNLEIAFSQLATQADAGDRYASCVLSRALALCGERAGQSDSAQRWIDLAAREAPGSSDERHSIDKIDEIFRESESSRALCDGLSSDRLQEADRRMFQAARLGDRRAMAHFALYSSVGARGSVKDDASEKLYRENAIEMLERSASQGNVRALRSLYEVYLHGVSPNRSDVLQVKKDEAAAVAIGFALMNKVGQPEKEYIAATLGRIDRKEELMASPKYLALQKKYFAYVDAISLQGFDESGKNIDLKACDEFR